MLFNYLKENIYELKMLEEYMQKNAIMRLLDDREYDIEAELLYNKVQKNNVLKEYLNTYDFDEIEKIRIKSEIKQSKYKKTNKLKLYPFINDDYIYPLPDKVFKDVNKFFEGIEEDFHYYIGVNNDNLFLENLKKAYILDLNYFYNEIEKIKKNIDINENKTNRNGFLNYEKYIENKEFSEDYYIEKFINFILIKLEKNEIKEIYDKLENKKNKNNIENKLLKFLEFIEKYFFIELSNQYKKKFFIQNKNHKSYIIKQFLKNLNTSNKNNKNAFSILKETKNTYLDTNLFKIGSEFLSKNFLDDIDIEEIKEKNDILYTKINQENKDNYNLKIIFNDLYRLYQINYLQDNYIEENKKYRHLLNNKILKLENVKNTFLEDIETELKELEIKQNFSNIHIFEKSGIPLLTLYEKEIDKDTIYIGGFNAGEKLGLGFKFLKQRIDEIGKEKNIKLFVIDSINGEKKDNSKLIKKYQKLGFQLQKDNNGNYIKDYWGKNNRNSDYIMIRPKGVK